MEKLKKLIRKAEHSMDWDEIRKGIKESTGDDLDLHGISTHYHFTSWEQLEIVLLLVAGKAFSAGIGAIGDPKKEPFARWYDDFIQKIKP